MATGYSLQYSRLYIEPLVIQYHTLAKGSVQMVPFDFVNTPALTAIGEKVYIAKVPPICEIVPIDSFFRHSAWSAGTTIDLGWLAYSTPANVVVAANDAGLIANLDVDAAGEWKGGLSQSSTGTVVRNSPVVDRYSVRSKEEVTITAVFRDTAPLAAATFSGYLIILV